MKLEMVRNVMEWCIVLNMVLFMARLLLVALLTSADSD